MRYYDFSVIYNMFSSFLNDNKSSNSGFMPNKACILSRKDAKKLWLPKTDIREGKELLRINRVNQLQTNSIGTIEFDKRAITPIHFTDIIFII